MPARDYQNITASPNSFLDAIGGSQYPATGMQSSGSSNIYDPYGNISGYGNGYLNGCVYPSPTTSPQFQQITEHPDIIHLRTEVSRLNRLVEGLTNLMNTLMTEYYSRIPIPMITAPSTEGTHLNGDRYALDDRKIEPNL